MFVFSLEYAQETLKISTETLTEASLMKIKT